MCGTKLQWQSHKDVINMNFSFIQTSLHEIIILQLILVLNNIKITIFIFIYNYIIVNFIKFNLYHVDTCHYIG
jgi:hypothetical protein